MLKNRRVAITGLGLITPNGNTTADSWSSVLGGTSGISLINTFDTEKFSVKIGGGIKDFDVSSYMDHKHSRNSDLFIHYGVAACKQAFNDSGLEVDESQAHRFGVSMGSGIGGVSTIA